MKRCTIKCAHIVTVHLLQLQYMYPQALKYNVQCTQFVKKNFQTANKYFCTNLQTNYILYFFFRTRGRHVQLQTVFGNSTATTATTTTAHVQCSYFSQRAS